MGVRPAVALLRVWPRFDEIAIGFPQIRCPIACGVASDMLRDGSMRAHNLLCGWFVIEPALAPVFDLFFIILIVLGCTARAAARSDMHRRSTRRADSSASRRSSDRHLYVIDCVQLRSALLVLTAA